jgi:hypothetical protein
MRRVREVVKVNGSDAGRFDLAELYKYELVA